MKRNGNMIVILALLLLAYGARSLRAQEPIPLDEPPADTAMDEEPPLDEEQFQEMPEEEMPVDQELPEEPPVEEEFPVLDEIPIETPPPPAVASPAKPKAPVRPKPRPPQVSSFKVRAALAGSGFKGGASGTLRVSSSGVSFTRQGESGEAWRIQWSDLAEAKNADGIWDAPHPLVIQERGGRKHYIALVDPQGRYLPGQEVLAAISKGQRKGG